MSDPGCPRGHVWMTQLRAKVSVCKNCGKHRPVFELPYNDPINVEKRQRKAEDQAMRAIKWTPGPWICTSDARVLACDERSTIICEPPASPSNPTVMADAHLIATAPQLYEALAWYVENDETDTDHGFFAEGRDRARKALASARGET